MSRKILEKRHIRKLGKTGRGASIAVTLPIEVVRQLRWRQGQKVVVKKYGKGIIIKDWPVVKKARQRKPSTSFIRRRKNK